jgi:tellurite resistance protein TerC
MYDNVKSFAAITYRQARRIVIFVVGLTILLIGVAGVVLPILPGWPLMFVGLFVLAIEFAWARRWLRKLKRTARHGAAYARAKLNGSTKAAA